MGERYYLIDFTASTGGTVRVKAKNRDEAWKLVAGGFCQVWDQVEDVMNNTRVSEFDIKFDKRSMTVDAHQDSGPGQDDEEE